MTGPGTELTIRNFRYDVRLLGRGGHSVECTAKAGIDPGCVKTPSFM